MINDNYLILMSLIKKGKKDEKLQYIYSSYNKDDDAIMRDFASLFNSKNFTITKIEVNKNISSNDNNYLIFDVLDEEQILDISYLENSSLKRSVQYKNYRNLYEFVPTMINEFVNSEDIDKFFWKWSIDKIDKKVRNRN